ncbi:MAG: hypothetical protein JSU70_07330 [Phycisphaerales bacterium]|nr:MAG: hypothetical protein JSU70_07330 [Phycisphaerales bacterium]
MTQVWQIAAGEKDRSYVDLFLNHDVMFMGPGRFGPYDKIVYEPLEKDGTIGKRIATQLRQFCTEVKGGDIVLLRLGSQAKAIGWIRPWKVPEYDWNPSFDDVFGWDLQHTRRVVWQHHLADELQKMQKTKDLFYSRGATFSKVHRIKDELKDLFNQCELRGLKPLPSVPKPLTLEKLGAELFTEGLPNEHVDKFILAIQRQRRLVRWYEESGKRVKRPSEHEVVAHMILPLLLALGWSEQLLAVEWRKVDLVAFRRTPTAPENCCLVCEAKGYGHGLQNVFAQATRYVKKLQLRNCERILLTDGARLYLYKRQKDDNWNENPVGYLNVNVIRTDHIIPSGTNGVDTIMALTPAGITREVGR